MKTKNEYLKEQGIDLEKDFSAGTYTKIRFAMENYANDYHESEVKKFCLAAVSGQSELLFCDCKGNETNKYYDDSGVKRCWECRKEAK
nr:hypothetical protein [uncultured Flavobacterium sp.]